MQQLSIRSAEPDEAAQLTELALESKASWGYSRDFMQSCRDELTVSRAMIISPDRDYFVAVADRLVVGFYALQTLTETEFALEALFVKPSHLDRGVGTLLLEHASDRVSAGGGQSLLIQSDPNAEGFYLAAGAARIGESESASIPGRYLPMLRISFLG